MPRKKLPNGQRPPQPPPTLKHDQRLFVEGLLATCTPPSLVVREVMKKYGIKERQAWEWYKATFASLAAEARTVDKDGRRAQMRATFSDCYQKALLARNFNAAVQALDRLCRLDGLYAPEELEANNKRGGVAERDPEKVRERIKELAGKMPHLVQPTDETLKSPTGGDEPLQ
jgi:hypothetical protein